jgi:hypothetical protein
LPKAEQHAGEEESHRRQNLREDAAAELGYEQTRRENAGGREQRRYEAQEEQGVSEELRRRGKERHDRGLIDVSPLRMSAANDEIQLVAKEVRASVSKRMDEKNDSGREPGSSFHQATILTESSSIVKAQKNSRVTFV